MNKKLLERIPASSNISQEDCNEEEIELLAQQILGEDETAPMSTDLCRKIIKEAIYGDRDFLIFRHQYYASMKNNDIREIVRLIANLIDLMVPAAKGNSVFANPLLDLIDHMQEFLAEMNAELGPISCGDGIHIGRLFNDTLTMEVNLIRRYNSLPKLYEFYLSNIKNNQK